MSRSLRIPLRATARFLRRMGSMDAAHSEQPRLIPAGPHAQVALDAAGRTDTGLHREKNEDSFLIATLQPTLVVHEATASAQGWFAGEPLGTLLIVADGMGGQGGGDVASRTAVNAVSNYLLNALPWGPPNGEKGGNRDSIAGLRGQLSSALVAGDATINTAGANSRTPRMGTTLTAAFVLWPVVYVAHVGDTRCYLLRNGQLRRLTTDHNMAEKFAAHHVPHDAVQLQSILWNTLGASDELPQPELSKLELAMGDTLLLCSDGLNHHVNDEQIQAVLENHTGSRACCAKLVELALAGGGTDNVTVLVARIEAARENAKPS
jgi:PPM family protein phosphatase